MLKGRSSGELFLFEARIGALRIVTFHHDITFVTICWHLYCQKGEYAYKLEYSKAENFIERSKNTW